MNIEIYNGLSCDEKLRWAWNFWNQFLDTDSAQFDESLYFRLYGNRRLFVNGKILKKRHESNFQCLQGCVLEKNKIFGDLPNLFPMIHLSNEFVGAKYVRVKKIIDKRRFDWIHREFEIGEKLELFKGTSYGVVSPWGIPIVLTDTPGFIEVPMGYLLPIREQLSSEFAQM